MASRTHEPEPLLTPAEVASMFRVDPKTVTRWAKAGKLSAIRTLGGTAVTASRRFGLCCRGRFPSSARETDRREFYRRTEQGRRTTVRRPCFVSGPGGHSDRLIRMPTVPRSPRRSRLPSRLSRPTSRYFCFSSSRIRRVSAGPEMVA